MVPKDKSDQRWLGILKEKRKNGTALEAMVATHGLKGKGGRRALTGDGGSDDSNRCEFLVVLPEVSRHRYFRAWKGGLGF